MKRKINIIQTNIETGKERRAEMCWRYIVYISEWAGRTKSPAAILDAMLWGDKIATANHTYHIDQ